MKYLKPTPFFVGCRSVPTTVLLFDMVAGRPQRSRLVTSCEEHLKISLNTTWAPIAYVVQVCAKPNHLPE